MTDADLDRIARAVEALPDVLDALLAPYAPATLTKAPSDGEWSVHQVIEHLVTGDGPAFRARVIGIVQGDERMHRSTPPR